MNILKRNYAWLICFACMLLMFICSGLLVNAFSVLQPYILKEQSFTNTQTSMIITVRSAFWMLSMIATPKFYKWFGYRYGMTISAFLATLSLVIFAFAEDLFVYYLAAAIAGIAQGLGYMVPITILITRWFRSHHGIAFGICAAGSGLAPLLLSTPIATAADNFSLKTAFLFVAAVGFVLMLLILLVIRNDPAACGYEMYGTHNEIKKEKRKIKIRRPGKVRFVLLYTTAALISVICATGSQHQTLLFSTVGYPEIQASVGVSVFGLTLMLSKLLFGAIADRFGTKVANYVIGGSLLIGTGMYAFIGHYSNLYLYIASAIFGLGGGITSVGFSSWAEDFSDEDTLAYVLLRFQLCASAGAFIFSFVPGLIADISGSYNPSYILFLAFAIFGMITVQSSYKEEE